MLCRVKRGRRNLFGIIYWVRSLANTTAVLDSENLGLRFGKPTQIYNYALLEGREDLPFGQKFPVLVQADSLYSHLVIGSLKLPLREGIRRHEDFRHPFIQNSFPSPIPFPTDNSLTQIP